MAETDLLKQICQVPNSMKKGEKTLNYLIIKKFENSLKRGTLSSI